MLESKLLQKKGKFEVKAKTFELRELEINYD